MGLVDQDDRSSLVCMSLNHNNIFDMYAVY